MNFGDLKNEIRKIEKINKRIVQTKNRIYFNYIYITSHLIFHPPKVTPRIHSDELTVQELCYRNSSASGWHNSHHSGIVSITN